MFGGLLVDGCHLPRCPRRQGRNSSRRQAAACAPLMTGSVIRAVLYVDSIDPPVRPDRYQRDLDFTIALAQFASVALTNLGRVDIERRFAAARSSMFEGTVRALAAATEIARAVNAAQATRCGLSHLLHHMLFEAIIQSG